MLLTTVGLAVELVERVAFEHEARPGAEEQACKCSHSRGHGERSPLSGGLIAHVEGNRRHEQRDAHRDGDGDTDDDPTDEVVLGLTHLLDPGVTRLGVSEGSRQRLFSHWSPPLPSWSLPRLL